MERLVVWENSESKLLLDQVRQEIHNATNGEPPVLLDPFSGGGSIPLEGQRLGLTVHTSDLNPIAVLTTKAIVELPQLVSGLNPINPDSRGQIRSNLVYAGSAGLSEDIKYYGKWLVNRAEVVVGRQYPEIGVQQSQGTTLYRPIAWLWARMVPCPNPACGVILPLIRSLHLSKKAGRKVFAVPRISRDRHPPRISFEISIAQDSPTAGTVSRKGAKCLCCQAAIPLDYIRKEGRLGHLGMQMLAAVVATDRGREYLAASEDQGHAASHVNVRWTPETALPEQALGFRVQAYGMTRHADLFTQRQLSMLSTLYNLVREALEVVERDFVASGVSSRSITAKKYSEIVCTYLALICDKVSIYNNSLV